MKDILIVPTAFLQDRGVVHIGGEEARGFLQNILTCNLDQLAPGKAQFGALLTPQGKLLFDFVLHEAPAEDGGGFYADINAGMASEFIRRLTLYKLRAKIVLRDVSEHFGVLVGWGDAPADASIGLLSVDPRSPALGWRMIAPREDIAADGAASAYHAHRIALGIPEGGKDFLFGDTFPHEAMMDVLHGVDFAKGCYIGQEVVSRMQHRGTARTRIVTAFYPQGFAADTGAPILAGERQIGKAGSASEGGRGLALVRLDKLEDALASGEPIRAGGIEVVLQAERSMS